MKKTLSLFLVLSSLLFVPCSLLFFSCGETQNNNSSSADSMSKKDSVKKALSEDLPPPDEIHQFKWFYSAFVSALIDWNDTAINACIDDSQGLWVIDAPGVTPHFTRVYNDSAFKAVLDKDNFHFDRNDLIADPKEGELPKANCDKSGGYDKEGCFTTELNEFAAAKIWTYAGLLRNDEMVVQQMASNIIRTVVNTKVGKFYFSLDNRGWHLIFIDIRKPCQA